MNLANIPEDELIGLAKTGDLQAFNELMLRRHYTVA